MTATLILKIGITGALVVVNLIWVFLCVLANGMRGSGEFDDTSWKYLLIPTFLNVLIIWSMWE